MSDVDAQLQTALGAPAPAAVTALPESDRARLVTLIETAKTRQDAVVEKSFNDSLKLVPLPIRRVVRKVLFG